jgi:hypothetical protein
MTSACSMHRLAALATTLWLASCATPPPPVVEQKVDIKAELRGHGEWVVVAPWGRVWHPNATEVGQDFQPYLTGGGWVRGADGWNFESRWPWGKYVFRTGRWFMADDLGWLWWPNEMAGPAWVQWRAGDGFVGWSPLPPEVQGARHQPPPWFYVKERSFSARDVATFSVKGPDVPKVHAATQPMAGAGPDVEALRTVGGLDRDPPVPEAPPPAVEAAPEPPPEEAAPPPPPPKKKTKKSTGKKR